MCIYNNNRWNSHILWPNTILTKEQGLISNSRDQIFDKNDLTVLINLLLDRIFYKIEIYSYFVKIK